MQCIQLPFEFSQWMDANQMVLKDVMNEKQESIDIFVEKMKKMTSNPRLLELILNNCVAFGPQRFGPNILLIKNINRSILNNTKTEFDKKIINNIITGFDIAT